MKLFVGLEIPEPVRLAVAERTDRVKRSLPHASWVSCSNYHLFLSFLGEIDESSLAVVGAALTPTFACQKRVELQLARAGSFPPRRPARVLWIGVEDSEALDRLHRAVWTSLARVAELEASWRPFHAHLTVARCSRPWPRRSVEVWCRTCTGKVGRSFEIRRGALFSSESRRDGCSYRVVETYPLRGVH